jgi:hypothetical protein
MLLLPDAALPAPDDQYDPRPDLDIFPPIRPWDAVAMETDPDGDLYPEGACNPLLSGEESERWRAWMDDCADRARPLLIGLVLLVALFFAWKILGRH